MEKWFNRPHNSINEKNLQNVGLKGNINYIKPYNMTFLSCQNKLFMLRLFKQKLTIAKFALINFINADHTLITQILGLKTEEKCFFVIQIPVTKIIGKTAILTIFCFCVYLFLITQFGNLCSYCSNLMYNDATCGIFFVMLITCFFPKKVLEIKILPHLLKHLSCFFGLKKLLRLISQSRNG